MKKIFLVLAVALASFTSCDFGEDGRSYLSISYEGNEPSKMTVSYFVSYDDGDMEQVFLPYSWIWGEYYHIDEGAYRVDFETTYTRHDLVCHEQFYCDIEVFVNKGKSHHTDGKDVFFDLKLFDDGKFDYNYFEIKSYTPDSEDEIVMNGSKSIEGYEIKYTLHRVGVTVE
ncbi:MAG: hypothetical protein MJ198_05335 [Bacteroidales bacterium]|nr:hypothetical protein [Bacteroidales bacterium]